MRRPLVDFERREASPVIEPDFRGVAVRVAREREAGAPSRLGLHGVYQIDGADADAVTAGPLHEALVVVVTAGLVHRAWRLVGEQIVFADDEHRGRVARGFFNVDLGGYVALERGDRCFVLVALGPFVSNVVEIRAD